MADLPCVYDQIGVLGGENGRRVRLVITVEDGPPAVLWELYYGEGGLSREAYPLMGWSKPAWQGFPEEHFLVEGRHQAYVMFNPQGCNCGAGRLPYEELIEGRDLVKVRTPSWLES